MTFAYCTNGAAGTIAGPGCCSNQDGGAHIRYETVTLCGGGITTIIADPEGGGNQGGGPSTPGTGSPGTGSSGTAGGNTGGGISVPPTYPGTSTPGGSTGGGGSTNGGGTAPNPGSPNPGNPLDGNQNPGTGGGGSGTGGGKKPIITGPIDLNPGGQTAPAVVTIKQHLEKLSASNNYNQSIAYLKEKAEGTKEYAWAYKYFSGTQTISPPAVVGHHQKDPDKVDLTPFTGGDYIGAMHNHPEPSKGAVPMFSPGDIKWLSTCARKHTPTVGEKDYNAYFLLLIVQSGTYALKIKDRNKFIYLNPKYVDIDKELVRLYKISGSTASAATLQKDLLTVLKKYDIGVGLYQEVMVNGIKVWHELSLNNAGNVVLTPVN